MRYVGRHRAPRPLLLRRPVAGGVAAAVALAVPVLYATGNFSGAIQGGTPTKQIADGTKRTSAPVGAETGSEGTVIPVDGSVESTSGPAGTSNVGATGTGIGVVPGTGAGNQTTRPGTTATRPGTKPTKTTKPPTKTTTTTKPVDPPDPEPTTKPPVATTNPPVPTTNPPDPTTNPPDPEAATTATAITVPDITISATAT